MCDRGVHPVLSLLLLPAVACAGDTAARNGVARDSAGVAVVVSTDSVWTDAVRWRIDPEPVVSIGTIQGSVEYQLDRVRGAVGLANGTIVVADGGSSQLRFYDAKGTHIRSVGDDGEGPGEFRVISDFWKFAGDSLLVFDFRLRRLTVFAPDGTLARTYTGPSFDEPIYYYMHGAFDDGSVLGQIDGGADPQLTTGVHQNVATYFRFAPDGAVDTIADLFSSESYIRTGENSLVAGMPFGRRAVFAVTGDRFHYGSSDSFELAMYTSDGELQRIVRATLPTKPLTSQHVEEFITRATERMEPGRRRGFEELHRTIPYPRTMPAYGDLRVDVGGNLWVGEFVESGASPRYWTVIAEDGRLLGTVEMPPSLTVYEIGNDSVLGMYQDELDVQHIVLLRIVKPF